MAQEPPDPNSRPNTGLELVPSGNLIEELLRRYSDGVLLAVHQSDNPEAKGDYHIWALGTIERCAVLQTYLNNHLTVRWLQEANIQGENNG